MKYIGLKLIKKLSDFIITAPHRVTGINNFLANLCNSKIWHHLSFIMEHHYVRVLQMGIAQLFHSYKHVNSQQLITAMDGPI